MIKVGNTSVASCTMLAILKRYCLAKATEMHVILHKFLWLIKFFVSK